MTRVELNLSYIFSTEFAVRDYECDIQGILNNSVYQNYMEHTRHEYLKSLGHDFAELHTRGIDPVVYRVEIDFVTPLKSGDTCVCKLALEKEGNLKAVFRQDIFRVSDDRLCASGKIIAVVLQNNRPVRPDFLLFPPENK